MRVALFTVALGSLATVAFLVLLAGGSYAIPGSVALPWPLVAAGFLIAELKVVDVHFRREKHSFSLSEFPAVIGLFTLTPTEYLLAVVTGTAIALVWERQAPIKLFFNLVNFAAAATLTMVIFQYGVLLVNANPIAVWAVAFAATFASAIYSAVTIATAISLSGGAPQYQKLPEMIQFGTLVAVANTSLALLAVAVLLVGVWPAPIVEVMDATLGQLLNHVAQSKL